MLLVCEEPSYAATVHSINVRKEITKGNFSFNESKLSSITWKPGISHKQAVNPANSYGTSYAVKIPTFGKAATLSGDICTLHFKNVGTIAGRNVNCDVTFSNFHTDAIYYTGHGEDKNGYIGIFGTYRNSDSIEIGTDGFLYHSNKYIDYRYRFTYADTGTIVDIPFINKLTDIDASSTYYAEGWEAVEGYSGDYYLYSNKDINGNYLNSYVDKNGTRHTPYPLQKSTSGNNITFKAPKYVSLKYPTTGMDVIYCSGFYAKTVNGNFSNRYYFGQCAMNSAIYNQYSSGVMTTPSKVSNKTKANPDDEITYTITHKMGMMYETVLTTYGNLDIVDKIPEEFSYISADVYDGKGNNITASAGTLTYDPGTNTVSYKFNQDWVDDKSNYNGQNISMKVRVKVNDVDAVSTKTTNQAEIMMEGNRVTLPSTNAGVEVVNAPKFQIIKRVKKDDYTDPHGCETFLFKIKSKKTGREWYRSVTFKDSDKSASGYWTFSENGDYEIATGKVEELPIDDEYNVSEVSVSRYKEVSKNIKVDGRTYIYTFENTKDSWQYYSHNHAIINTLSQK